MHLYPRQGMTPRFHLAALATLALVALALVATTAAGAPIRVETPAGNTDKRPSFGDVESTVRKTFARQTDRQPDDIISRGEVLEALRAVHETGWSVPEPEKLLQKILLDDDYLVRQLRTRHGRRFMRKVGGRKLMYDQLDRVARVPGGQALVRDLPKLPDADRQAAHLEQFLPKMGSGRRRQVKDFDKPTERIYTVDQLVEALRKIYAQGDQ